jgi:hypothetical protein
MANWIVGQSGNPKRKRYRSARLSDLARRIGAEIVEFRTGGDTLFDQEPELTLLSRRERLCRILWTQALDGDLKAAQLLVELLEGRTVEAVVAQMSFTADDYARMEARVMTWRTSRTQINADGMDSQDLDRRDHGDPSESASSACQSVLHYDADAVDVTDGD